MDKATNFYAPSKTNIEKLQVILAEQIGTDITFKDAEEVGIQLVSLYECLARKRSDIEEEDQDDIH